MRLPHLIGTRASPPHLYREGSPLPHLRQDQAHRCLICTETELTAATSAPGLGSPLPHLRRDWAHRCHICARTVLKSVYGQRLRASDGRGIVGVAVVIRLVAPGRVGAQQGYPDSLSEPIEAFPIVRLERASHCRGSRIDFHRTERGPRSMRKIRWRRSREIARARARARFPPHEVSIKASTTCASTQLQLGARVSKRLDILRSLAEDTCAGGDFRGFVFDFPRIFLFS
jgi:hypothetical protein